MTLARLNLWSICLIFQGVYSLHCWAGSIDISHSIHPVPVTLSGTLHPFAFSLNGKQVPAPASNPQEPNKILLNGQPIPTNELDPSGSLYLNTESDIIQVDIVYLDGSHKTLLKSVLPSIHTFKLGEDYLRVTLDGPFESLILDKDSVPIKDGGAMIEHPSEQEWYETPHVMEIRDQSGQSRIYNLDSSHWYDAILSDRWVFFGNAPSHTASGQGIGIGYGKKLGRSWLAETQLVFATRDLNGTAYSDKSDTFAVNINAGWSPWLGSDRFFDWRRISFGLWFSYGNESRTIYDANGSPSASIGGTFLSAGPFIRVEPFLLFSNLGVVVNISPSVIRGDIDASTVQSTLAVSWHF